MKPSELRLLTEKSKHRVIDNDRALEDQADRERKQYIEDGYAFNLRILDAILTEAAKNGKNEVSVFDWVTNHPRGPENLEIATRLEFYLIEDGHSISYLDYDYYQASYDAQVERCRSLMVSW